MMECGCDLQVNAANGNNHRGARLDFHTLFLIANFGQSIFSGAQSTQLQHSRMHSLGFYIFNQTVR